MSKGDDEHCRSQNEQTGDNEESFEVCFEKSSLSLYGLGPTRKSKSGGVGWTSIKGTNSLLGPLRWVAISLPKGVSKNDPRSLQRSDD